MLRRMLMAWPLLRQVCYGLGVDDDHTMWSEFRIRFQISELPFTFIISEFLLV